MRHLFTVQEVGTVTREHPWVVQRHDNGDLLREHLQLSKVEVATMQVVKVHDVGHLRDEIQESPRPWEFEVLDAELGP